MDEEPAATPRSVRATYDRIAEHFAATREYPWPEVRAFLSADIVREDGVDRLDDDVASALGGGATRALTADADASSGTASRDAAERIDTAERIDAAGRLGLDLGCGNGRHAELLAGVVEGVVGVDVSGELLRTARARASERGVEDVLGVVQADAGALPLRSGIVDVAVYVATLHHLRPRERRVSSLSELARVLAPGGRALVSAWSTAHDRFDADSGFDTTVEWTLPGGERVPRFYHIYDPAEFEADLDASDLRVVDAVVSSGNCYAVVESSGT
jgi:SAM-dependent methyltransferase